MNDKITPQESATAFISKGGGHHEELNVHGHYEVVCTGYDGQVKWTDTIDNVVTTVGKNDLLTNYLKGAAYTQTFRMGLKGPGTAIAADTQASHGSWSEVGLANNPTYSGSRPSITFNAASAGAIASPATAFSMTSSGTVSGCFMNNGGSATIDNTTGVLFSAGDFSGGIKVVSNLDTLNVTYNLSV